MPPNPTVHEWMDQWSDLEARLSRLLAQPRASAHFVPDVEAIHAQLVEQLDTDADSTLYWLLQLATSSTVSYSSSHALVCASLCHLVAPLIGLTAQQQRSLALAALTMNLAMTQLQDQLTRQADRPTAEQRALIDEHAILGTQWLTELGVRDADWLRTVEHHHQPGADNSDLARALAATDRYAALMSPRETRSGRCVTDSARGVLARSGSGLDDVGHALLRTLGICPPGTFVRLEDERVAVVLRRGKSPGTPWVAPVLDSHGLPVVSPELIDTSNDGCGIEAALIANTVRVRLPHARLLQLSRQFARISP